MSLTLLLEKYDVSTEEGLQKALNEIEKEECDVNESLTNALSRACTLEGRLRAASQTYSKLGEVKNDAQVATAMVDKTAALARDVSAKVRQLDLARSRVAECQSRVHDLIDLRVCSAGVEAAIKAQDYETAAAHVSRFLCMEPGSVAAARARGPDPRRDMDAAAATLRDRLLRKFEEAAKREDDAAVERLFELFPRIGRAEEGVDLLAGYLASQLEATLRRAGDAPSRGGAVFADALTRALEAGAAAVERARRLLPPAPPAPPGLLPRALRALQPTVCACVRRLSSSLARAPSLAERPEPLRVEADLAELALAHSRMQLYFNFLRRRVEANADGEAAARDAAATERLIAECDMTRTAQDVLAHYLTLERWGPLDGGNPKYIAKNSHVVDRASRTPTPAPAPPQILLGGERRQGAEAVDAGARRDRLQPGGRRVLHREEGHQARHLHGQPGRGLRGAERGGRAAGAGGAGAAAAAGLPAARRSAAGRAPRAAAARARARGGAVPGAGRRGGGGRGVGGAPGARGGGGGGPAVPRGRAGAGQAALVRRGSGRRRRRLPRGAGSGRGGAARGAAARRHRVGGRARGPRRRRRRVGRGGGRAAGGAGRAGGGGAGAAAALRRRAAGRRAGRPPGARAPHHAAAALLAARRAGGGAALPARGGVGGGRGAGRARAGGRAVRRRGAAGAGARGARARRAGAGLRAVAGRRQGGAGAPRGLRPGGRAAPAAVSEGSSEPSCRGPPRPLIYAPKTHPCRVIEGSPGELRGVE